MGNNSQARKWMLTINNPLEAGLDHDSIRDILLRFSPSYYCMADEIATSRPAQGERVEITTGRRSRAVITSHPAKGVRVEI